MKKFLLKIIKNKFLLILILLLIGISFISVFSKKKKFTKEFITYPVKKQDIVISVIEGGNLIALRSQQIINEVPGQRTILEVVEEGTKITEEDIKKGKVLIKLDSKDLEDQAQQLEITVENNWSSYVEAQENLEMQKKQNESDIRDAELKVKFAKMDLEKYIGKKLAEEVIKNKTQYYELMKDSELEGESLQKKKELESKIDLAKEEIARAKDRVEWSEKLAKEGYITASELEADKLSLKQKEINLNQALLEYQLFLNYDFPKQVEKLISDYMQYCDNLERVKNNCKSKIIQGESNVKSRKATYLLNKNKLDDLNTKIAKCTIKATQPGFVVYATSGRGWRIENPIRQGTTVYQFQELLNLPDFNSMGVEIKIHESYIEKIKPGQKATVKVDAFPDKIFTGEVKKIALMPDPTLKWLNPDINVYVAQIALNETFDFLKPGMSAKVEILVEKLENVLAIPILAVFFKEGKPFCTVLKGNRTEIRSVELGKSNDEIIEIKRGLSEGEIIVISSEKILPQMKKKPYEEKGHFEEKIKNGRRNNKI